MELDIKYLNAINILTSGKLGVLQLIHDKFDGDFKRAWNSDLSKYIPRERNEEGKLVAVDYKKLQKSIDPEKEFKKLEKEKIDIITILDNSYPELLRHISDPPFLLYVRGSKDVWSNNCFGVVGTRALTEYGKRSASKISFDLARAGFTIVSGLAAGIDTLAHKAALEAGAKTIAVLGCGIDDRTIFPVQNLGLAHKIIEEGGTVMSEYPIGMHGSGITFPQRNRIVSGLSRGVLVIEADIQSGAMITARLANEQGRDVFSIPGSIFAKMCEGTNLLLKKGAKPVTCAEDILEGYEMYLDKKEIEIKADNELEEKILSVLNSDAMTTDAIIRKTGLNSSEVNATLAMMEIKKKIKNLNGKFILNK